MWTVLVGIVVIVAGATIFDFGVARLKQTTLQPPPATMGLAIALEGTRQELDHTKQELEKTKQELQHTQVELTFAKQQVTALQHGPSGAQAAPVHDAEWNRIRQEANKDVSEYMDGPLHKLADSVEQLVVNIPKETVGTQLNRAEDLKLLLIVTRAEQDRMLRKYFGINDVVDLGIGISYLRRLSQRSMSIFQP